MSVDDWARLRSVVERALPYCHGTHKIEDIEAGLASGRFRFWGGERSAVVTETVQYPQYTALCFALAAGEMDEVRRMVAHVESYARAAGIKHLQWSGRPGWARVFPEYRRLSVTYGKEL